MVNKFSLVRTPRIIFGSGQVKALPDLLKNKAKRLLMLTGSGSYLHNEEIVRVLSAFEPLGIQVYHEKIAGEPSPENIDRITGMYRKTNMDAVVAIGGGSVMDAGKAVSAMLQVEGSVRDYLEVVGTRSHPGTRKYFIAIPTTAGTGSETTSNAVLSHTGPNGFKRSLRHENFVPDIALVDPLLTVGCPAEITAASGMDAFTQLVESFLSVKSNPYTDVLALDGIRKVHDYLVRASKHGDDIEARIGMSYAAMLSGITLSNAGLGLIHGFASALGAAFDVPHGLICGTLMAIVNRYNVEALAVMKESGAAHEKYAVLGKIFSDQEGKNRLWYMRYAVSYMEELTDKLNIKRLGEFGIREKDLLPVVSVTDHKSNPVRFEEHSLSEMLSGRL